ncbi:hypothetical protein EH223_21095 [candidate division KSB1 bacterium]|nr:1-acyl-sn-glycerol-3-phosphate acyltransferase [candidate division KSB1 bacterium]RQV99752.1 MAG: hypothetical protein EH223_21095 [candidate division KSB1 bacterium]
MAKEKTTRKFSATLYILLRLTFIPYLIVKYRIKGENKKLFKTLKPPFILIPNHVSMFDPPMVNIFVPHRVHFVMSDANLRSKLAQWAYLRLCNVIPKTKAVSDSAAVRKIVQLVRRKRVICVFGEGRSSWDGVTHDIFFSTAKLVKILKIPVVVPLIQGGYLTHPRWGTSVRPGRLVIRYKKIYDGPELAGLRPEDIYRRLLKEMWHDDYQYQRHTGLTFKTKKGAEYLERVIFCCPVCHNRECLRSEGNQFYCTSCGFETTWTPQGYLQPQNRQDQPTRSVTEWVTWQKQECDRKIDQMLEQHQLNEPIFSDNDVILKIGYKLQPLKEIMRGTMLLYLDRFVVNNSKGEAITFPIADVEGVQVLLANRFEFYYQGSLYKFEFSNPRCSGYKYMCVIQKIAPEKTELE